ncbi:integrase arm-type DNA-binding domain-containing protein [Pasteurella sp. PK-2025]|uniref:integrase arm-type DNA-binding domain-containing protein n=1 Tax=Pasteurella sp. PK-2025 TaxID=3413133 RepID=UPI003C777FDB
MAKIIKPLTVMQINNAKPKENKKSYLSDGNGLRLVIYPNGSKSWLFNYLTPYVKKRLEITIGKYPDVSLQNARAKAMEYREYLAQNLDPQEVENEKYISERNARLNTFEVVARKWLEYREKIGKDKKDYTERTKIDTTRRVESLIDVIGEIPFKQLTLQHGLDALENTRRSGALFELRKRYFVLKKIGEYAEKFKYWDSNVWRFIGDELPSPDRNRHYPAIHYKDLPELLKDLRRANTHYSVLLSILWGLLNITRASETVSARFEDIKNNDYFKDMVIWTVKVSKGGKGERDHIIPLSKQALKLLDTAKRFSRNNYLFPGIKRNGKYPHVNSQSPNNVIKCISNGKYKGIMTNHGIRTLFSSYCNDKRFKLELDKEIIEVCLSHLDNDKVRNAYNRAEYLPYRLKTFQAWADYVEKCAGELFDEIISDKN